MKITIIGAGEMGGAFAQGLLRGSKLKAADITMANRTAAKLKPFAVKGVNATTDNVAAVRGADIVAIVVPPSAVMDLCEQLRPVLDMKRQIIVNLAASVSPEQMKLWLSCGEERPRIVHAMPNLGIAVRQSMTFLVTDPDDQEAADTAHAIFADLGQVLCVDYGTLKAGNALAGCGIAFVMRFIRAASEAGVELGLNAKLAQQIVMQTMTGAVWLLREEGDHPEAAIDKVTTPGGLTIKGLNAMERHGFSSALIEGIKAVCN